MLPIECCSLAVQSLQHFLIFSFPCCCKGISQRIPDCLVVQVIWGYRWLIFRIMIGAGMIKAQYLSAAFHTFCSRSICTADHQQNPKVVLCVLLQ